MLFDKQGRALTATPIDAELWARLRALRQTKKYKLVGMINDALRAYLYRLDTGEDQKLSTPSQFVRKPRGRRVGRLPTVGREKSLFGDLAKAG